MRYERLSTQVEDIFAEIDIVRAGFAEISPRDISHIRAADALSRKANDIVYSLRNLGSKLTFAISRYEDWDRRFRHNDDDMED